MPDRDWLKDWEICQKATGGKWTFYSDRLYSDNIVKSNPDIDSITIAKVRNKADGIFIAEAREGWPAALEERARCRPGGGRIKMFWLGFAVVIACGALWVLWTMSRAPQWPRDYGGKVDFSGLTAKDWEQFRGEGTD